jgi:hypothetical protein
MIRILIAAGAALILLVSINSGASAKTTVLGSHLVSGQSLVAGTVLAQRGRGGGHGGGGHAAFRGGGGGHVFRGGGGGRALIRGGGGRRAFVRGGGVRHFTVRRAFRGHVRVSPRRGVVIRSGRYRGRRYVVRRGRRHYPYVALGFGLPYLGYYGYPYDYDDDCYALGRVWTRYGWRYTWLYVCD